MVTVEIARAGYKKPMVQDVFKFTGRKNAEKWLRESGFKFIRSEEHFAELGFQQYEDWFYIS